MSSAFGWHSLGLCMLIQNPSSKCTAESLSLFSGNLIGTSMCGTTHTGLSMRETRRQGPPVPVSNNGGGLLGQELHICYRKCLVFSQSIISPPTLPGFTQTLPFRWQTVMVLLAKYHIIPLSCLRFVTFNLFQQFLQIRKKISPTLLPFIYPTGSIKKSFLSPN